MQVKSVNDYYLPQLDHGEDKPTNCDKTCDDLDANGKLSLSCIDCDDIPQMSDISIFWQVTITI